MPLPAAVSGFIWGIRIVVSSRIFWKVMGALFAARAAWRVIQAVDRRMDKEIRDIIGAKAKSKLAQRKDIKILEARGRKARRVLEQQLVKVKTIAGSARPPKKNGVLFDPVAIWEDFDDE